MEIKIEKHLNYDVPVIYITSDNFNLEITKDEIEIECDWDYGYGGRGTERIYIKTELLLKLLEEIKGE